MSELILRGVGFWPRFDNSIVCSSSQILLNLRPGPLKWKMLEWQSDKQKSRISKCHKECSYLRVGWNWHSVSCEGSPLLHCCCMLVQCPPGTWHYVRTWRCSLYACTPPWMKLWTSHCGRCLGSETKWFWLTPSFFFAFLCLDHLIRHYQKIFQLIFFTAQSSSATYTKKSMYEVCLNLAKWFVFNQDVMMMFLLVLSHQRPKPGLLG